MKYLTMLLANVKDFEKFAQVREVHAGIIFICNGELNRAEQIDTVSLAVKTLLAELTAGRDRINRVLYVEVNGSLRFEYVPRQ